MSVSYGTNLKRAREKRGWSQAQLAERAGLDPSTIAMIELGKRDPRIGTATKLAEALGIYTVDLIGDSGTPAPRAQSFGAFDAVPMVRAAHAGAGTVLQETGAIEYVAAELGYRGMLLAAEIVGDCLEPDIQPGDVVLFDQRRRDPQHGEIVVVTSAEGELMVRRVVRPRPGGDVWLTDRHNSMEQPDGLRMEGVVVEIRRRPGRGR